MTRRTTEPLISREVMDERLYWQNIRNNDLADHHARLAAVRKERDEAVRDLARQKVALNHIGGIVDRQPSFWKSHAAVAQIRGWVEAVSK